MESNKEKFLSDQINEGIHQEQLKEPCTWEDQTKEEEKWSWFRKLGGITVIYALFYTFCMYDNAAGITMPLWILATILYARYALKRFEIPQKKDGIFHIVIMILLGISTFITGNPYIIALNYIGFFLLLLSFLLHTIHDDRRWGIGTYLSELSYSILGAIGYLSAPFADAYAFQKRHHKKTNTKVLYVVLGLVMAVPSIIFLGGILASADAVFQKYLVNTLTSFVLPTNWLGALALFVFAFLSAYCGLCQLLRNPRTELKDVLTTQKWDPLIAITFTSTISLLYVLFCLIQVVYLFLGFGTLPDGISHAEYARTGFFQLLFVCFLNFVLVLVVQNYVKESRLLRGILLTICGCTFVMIASSAYRMILYITAYQLTFLRIFVLVALTVISFLMAGAVFSLFRNQFQIYRYSLIVVSIIYLGFSFSHVDYFIASYNLSQTKESSLSDTLQYIGTLSSDAAPVIADYMKQNKQLQQKVDAAYQNKDKWENDWIYGVDEDISWYLYYMERIHYLSENNSLRRFNVSHYIASKVFD